MHLPTRNPQLHHPGICLNLSLSGEPTGLLPVEQSWNPWAWMGKGANDHRQPAGTGGLPVFAFRAATAAAATASTYPCSRMDGSQSLRQVLLVGKEVLPMANGHTLFILRVFTLCLGKK